MKVRWTRAAIGHLASICRTDQRQGRLFDDGKRGEPVLISACRLGMPSGILGPSWHRNHSVWRTSHETRRTLRQRSVIGIARHRGRRRAGAGSNDWCGGLGARDRGRPRHQDRDRQARSRHSQEEPQALDDRHREGIVSRQDHRLPRGRRRADGRRLAHGGGQRRGLGRQGDRPGRARRRPLHLVRRTRPTRPGEPTPSWPTAAAIASAWSRARSSATG